VPHRQHRRCSQLEEDRFQINIQRGVRRVHDEKMKLLAKIHHGSE
jgi:hypothetical protein